MGEGGATEVSVGLLTATDGVRHDEANVSEVNGERFGKLFRFVRRACLLTLSLHAHTQGHPNYSTLGSSAIDGLCGLVW